jgi:hypothetical protein
MTIYNSKPNYQTGSKYFAVNLPAVMPAIVYQSHLSQKFYLFGAMGTNSLLSDIPHPRRRGRNLI